MSNAQDFAKRELSFLKDNHEHFLFEHLTKAYASARDLGYLSPEVLKDAESFKAWCEFLKVAAELDAGFAQGVVLQLLTSVVTGTSEIHAFPAYSNPRSKESSLSIEPPVNEKTTSDIILSGKIEALAFAGQTKRTLIAIQDQFYTFDHDTSSVTQKKMNTLGARTCPLEDIELKNMRAKLLTLPAEEKNSLWEKIYLGAAHVILGLCESSMETAIDYANERVQGGRKIMAWSEHKLQLADYSVKTRAAALMLSGCLAEPHAIGTDSARIALLNLQELATDVTSFGVQALGGAGYMKDYLQEKRFRDAHQLRSWFGSPQLTKINIFERTTHLG